MNIARIGGCPAGDVFEHRGLAGLGRRYDESALSPAYGREQVYDPGGDYVPGSLHDDTLVGEDGCEGVEVGASAGVIGIEAAGLVHADEPEVALSVLGGPYLSLHLVAGAQPEAPDLGLGNVHIVGPGPEGVLAQEAVALVHNLQNAPDQQTTVAFGKGLQDAVQQLVPAQEVEVLGLTQAHLLGQREQLLAVLAVQVRDVHHRFSSHRGHLEMELGWDNVVLIMSNSGLMPGNVYRPCSGGAGVGTAQSHPQVALNPLMPSPSPE